MKSRPKGRAFRAFAGGVLALLSLIIGSQLAFKVLVKEIFSRSRLQQVNQILASSHLQLDWQSFQAKWGYQVLFTKLTLMETKDSRTVLVADEAWIDFDLYDIVRGLFQNEIPAFVQVINRREDWQLTAETYANLRNLIDLNLLAQVQFRWRGLPIDLARYHLDFNTFPKLKNHLPFKLEGVSAGFGLITWKQNQIEEGRVSFKTLDFAIKSLKHPKKSYSFEEREGEILFRQGQWQLVKPLRFIDLERQIVIKVTKGFEQRLELSIEGPLDIRKNEKYHN